MPARIWRRKCGQWLDDRTRGQLAATISKGFPTRIWKSMLDKRNSAHMKNVLYILWKRTWWMYQYIQGGPKKVSLRSLHVTSSNIGRFSKFFHCHILQEICNKVIIKYSTSPQTCRYITWWNIYVRKIVKQWNLSHHFVSQNWNITNICKIPDNCCW